MEERFDHFRAAVRLDPDNAGFRRDLARCLPANGRGDEAVEICSELIASDPANAQLRKALRLLLQDE